MKLLNKPVEMISLFSETGKITPVKFRYKDRRKLKVVKIDKVLGRNEENKTGLKIVLFKCQSTIDGEEQIFELIYQIMACKWYLYKL